MFENLLSQVVCIAKCIVEQSKLLRLTLKTNPITAFRDSHTATVARNRESASNGNIGKQCIVSFQYSGVNFVSVLCQCVPRCHSSRYIPINVSVAVLNSCIVSFRPLRTSVLVSAFAIFYLQSSCIKHKLVSPIYPFSSQPNLSRKKSGLIQFVPYIITAVGCLTYFHTKADEIPGHAI